MLAQREKCPNTDFFQVRMRENTDQENLRIWTLFTQCKDYLTVYLIKLCVLIMSNTRFRVNLHFAVA